MRKRESQRQRERKEGEGRKERERYKGLFELREDKEILLAFARRFPFLEREST